MREDDSFGPKLEDLDAEKGHFAAQKVSSRSSRMIGILETAQEIELAEAGIASKETAQVKMNNQLAQILSLLVSAEAVNVEHNRDEMASSLTSALAAVEYVIPTIK